MKKKSKAGIIIAIILGIFCATLIALCVVLFINGSAGALNNKSRTDKKSDFKETEEAYDSYYYEGEGEDFEIVANEVIPETTPQEGAVDGNQSEYLCPESNQRALTASDITAFQSMPVDGLPANTTYIEMVLSEILARRGYQFDDQAIQAYFDSKTWYQEIAEKTNDMEAVLKSMDDVEIVNVILLQAYVE